MALDLKALFPNSKFPTAEELKAKENEFSVGDRVKVANNIRCIQHGQIGTIIQIEPEDKYGWKSFIVKFDDEKYGAMGFQSGNIDKILEGESNMKKINENAKVTLTLGQLRRLVKESSDEMKTATVYHISRNKFSKFKLSPTNSGMGTSFYGYGLYFACDKSTMDYYKEQMGKPYYIYEVTLDSTNFVDEWDEEHGLEYYGQLVDDLGSEQAASRKMLKDGITGLTYFSPEDGNSIVIYTDKVVKNFKLIESSEPVNENTKVTLTLRQLKRLVKESVTRADWFEELTERDCPDGVTFTLYAIDLHSPVPRNCLTINFPANDEADAVDAVLDNYATHEKEYFPAKLFVGRRDITQLLSGTMFKQGLISLVPIN